MFLSEQYLRHDLVPAGYIAFSHERIRHAHTTMIGNPFEIIGMNLTTDIKNTACLERNNGYLIGDALECLDVAKVRATHGNSGISYDEVTGTML